MFLTPCHLDTIDTTIIFNMNYHETCRRPTDRKGGNNHELLNENFFI